METLNEHARAKAMKFGHVAICLAYEVAVISLWLVAAAYFQVIGDWAHAKGAPAVCVDIFKWVSSIVLLLLVVTHVLHDLVHTLQDAYKTFQSPEQHQKERDDAIAEND
jgi:hypothetical protein